MSGRNPHFDSDLDLYGARKAVWLVKLPKYVAERWQKAGSGSEVGKMKIQMIPGQKSQVSLILSSAITNMHEDGQESIPEDLSLNISTVTQQTMGVFSHVMLGSYDSGVAEIEKLYMEGRITQKVECIPHADDRYMRMKMESIRKAAIPKRQPVSDHKNNIEYMQRKKADGKKARDDSDKVMDMLFAAFEKHQYYNIKDLVRITRQPVTYLKEIMKDLCRYNLKNPHRNMWELKPEYRHYKQNERATTMDYDSVDY
ncbi:hypothetical protein WA026_018506 [Henosepilachna vigintioctopunctata]|uniref:General transcription factor IIF subunit 2 n=1 Tax=Henosepilachna vigintioctopunctata TaxID=420089 RepID=A0AAW1UTR5_9CUCU